MSLLERFQKENKPNLNVKWGLNTEGKGSFQVSV